MLRGLKQFVRSSILPERSFPGDGLSQTIRSRRAGSGWWRRVDNFVYQYGQVATDSKRTFKGRIESKYVPNLPDTERSIFAAIYYCLMFACTAARAKKNVEK